MTDKDIIKALEYCKEQGITSECPKCPIKADCRRELIAIALDLIKRQQAEIYNLKEDLSEYRNMPILTKNDCLIATVEKRADGKQYHNALLTIKVDEIRAEAYKEFAERLKQVYWSNSPIDVCIREMVDNLVKELTEGNNG